MPFKFYLYAVVGLGVIAGVLAVIYSYNHAIARAKALEADVATLQSTLAKSEGANAELVTRHAELQIAFEKNRRERNTIATKWEQSNAKLQQALRQNPQTAAWADTTVPAAVFDSLRSAASAGGNSAGKATPANGPTAANPPARTDWRD